MRKNMFFCIAFLACARLSIITATPVVEWALQPAHPNQVVLLTGNALAHVSVTLCQLSLSACEIIPVAQASNNGIKFVIPGAMRADVYSITLCDATGCAPEVVLNQPEVHWYLTTNAQDGVAVPGSAVRLVGKCLSFANTDVDTFFCGPRASRPGLQMINDTQVALATTDGTEYFLADITFASCYRVDFLVPANMQPGTYIILLNNNLLAGVGANVGSIEIVKPTAWPSQSFVVSQNATLQDCLQAANASGGGIVHVPAGTYYMAPGQQLVLGQFVQLLGAGAYVTLIRWDGNDPGSSPDALIRGVPGTAWKVSDISFIVTSRVNRALSIDECVGCEVDNIQVLVFLPITLPPVQNALAIISSTNWAVSNSRFVHQGNCSASWPSNTAYYIASSQSGIFTNNSFSCWCQGHSTDSSRRIIFESNVIQSFGSDSEGSGFSSFEEPLTLQDIYVGGNVNIGNPAASKRWESMTFDGPNAAFFGNAVSVNSSSITLTNNSHPGFYPAAATQLLAVMQGPGFPAVRQLTSVSGDIVQVDEAIKQPLNESSVVSVVAYRGRFIFEGNTWINGTTVQLFGTAFDIVFSGNVLTNMTTGLLAWGRMYQNGWQPCYQVLTEYNVVECSGELATLTSTETTPSPVNFTGPYNFGHVHRNNSLVGGPSISVRGSSWQVVLDYNNLTSGVCMGMNKSAGTINVANSTSGVFVR